LEALVDSGHKIVGVVLPGLPLGPPIISQPVNPTLRLSTDDQSASQIDSLAARASASMLTIGDLRRPDAVTIINDLQPDVIVVACFPSRLPPEILQIPRLGSVNVHPSLLPRGRGPEPLFWTFRRGEPETGITIHLLNEHFDAGPILIQERIPVPDGVRHPDLEHRLAKLGGTLLLQAIELLANGRASLTPQDDAEATSAPIPCQADYDVPTDLPARWAFNFVRASARTTDRLKVVVMATKQEISITDAVSYSDNETPDEPLQILENRAVIGFQPGSVTFVLPQTD
jgi:methionyl-tRNA formyltransferase